MAFDHQHKEESKPIQFNHIHLIGVIGVGKSYFYFKLMEILEQRFKHGLTIKMFQNYIIIKQIETTVNKLDILRNGLKVNGLQRIKEESWSLKGL